MNYGDRPVWRWPYTWPRQNLSIMLGQIIDGSFSTNQDDGRLRSLDMRREVLIQCRERGLCQFNGDDCNAHLVSAQDIMVIPI